MTDYIYDVETYPNCFTLCIGDVEGTTWQYEISEFRNDYNDIRNHLLHMAHNRDRMVGYNNLGFDYPIIHMLIKNRDITALQLYDKGQAIMESDGVEHMVWESTHVIQQIDLYKIHHFDNNSRRTSLKVLEFNMRMENISDLPFPVGTLLTQEQIQVLHEYNKHDVVATTQFYEKSKDAIKFREELIGKYGIDCLNYNDTKIGKEYFIKRLEESAPGSCFIKGTRTKNQTIRPYINLTDCVFPWIRFREPEFNRMLQFFKDTTITETKGVFKYLNCTVNGFKFVFGLGGIHGSQEFREFHSDDDYQIIDLDVTSYYPSIAIKNRIYPQHLGYEFCSIYNDILQERKGHAKGTPENAVLKLALNGVYGDSNNKYSSFYDPQYTMTVTINGQLMLCLLAEMLMNIGIEMIQINTDGLTIKVLKSDMDKVEMIRHHWEMITGLDLEEALYQSMYVRDVNNYLAIYDDGKVKRKGAYEYERTWYQNHSALVVPRAVEQHLLHGTSVREFITGHTDLYDFMLRVKLPKNMRLVIEQDDQWYPLENTTRYYVSTMGGRLKKIMPPLKGKTEERINDIESGWLVVPCNDIHRATVPINYDYYIQEAEKLILEMR